MERERYIHGFYHFRNDIGDGTRSAVCFHSCSGTCTNLCMPHRFMKEHPFSETDLEKHYYTAEKLAEYLKEERVMCYTKKLGITFLGKEPLNDPYFCLDLAKAVRQAGMDLQVWTCGLCDRSSYDLLRSYVNLFVFNFCSPVGYSPFKEYDLDYVKESLFYLDQKPFPYRLRIPVIFGVNHNHAGALATYVSALRNVKSVILDFHQSGLEEEAILDYRRKFLDRGIILY